MDEYGLDRLRRQLDAGDGVVDDDVRRLIDDLRRAQRAASTPAEFVVRVARDGSDPGRWKASHPVLRFAPTAGHPADALILAGAELRSGLERLDWPVPEAEDDSHGLRTAARVDRTVAEATMREAQPTEAASIEWALGEIDRLRSELDDALDRRGLATAAAGGDAEARKRMRERAASTLAAAGVAVPDGGGLDGFGRADEVGLDLPCLALTLTTASADDVDGWRFDAGRPWFALHHQVEPRPMSRYEQAIVTPLAIGDDVELSLRRLAPRVRSGRSVGAYRAFAELVAVELPDVDVGAIRAPLSPGWVPFPVQVLPVLSAGTDDADLGDRLADLVETRGGPIFPRPHWGVAWIADELGDADFDW